MTLLTLFSGFGEAAVAPGLELDHALMFVGQADVGLHLEAADHSWNIASTNLGKKNILFSDVSRKVKKSSVRLNIREG